MIIVSFRCLDLIFLTFISWLLGRLTNLILAFSIKPNSSRANSNKLKDSSGSVSISSDNLLENSVNFMKSKCTIFWPFLIDSPNSFL